jgi:hypothetical protein
MQLTTLQKNHLYIHFPLSSGLEKQKEGSTLALIRRSRFVNGALFTVSASDFWNFDFGCLKGLSERGFGARSLGFLEVERSGASDLAPGSCFRFLVLSLCRFFGAIAVGV